MANQSQEISPFGAPVTPQQQPAPQPSNVQFTSAGNASSKEKNSALILFATGAVVGLILAWLLFWLFLTFTGQTFISKEEYDEYQQQAEIIQQLQNEQEAEGEAASALDQFSSIFGMKA